MFAMGRELAPPPRAAREILNAIRAELPRNAKRNAVFRGDVVPSAIAAAERHLASGRAADLAAVARLPEVRRRPSDPAEDLARYALVLALLRRGGLASDTAHALFRHGRACLHRADVDPTRSRLAHLHAELRAAIAHNGIHSFAATLGARREPPATLAERTLLEDGAVDTLCRLIEAEDVSEGVPLARLRVARARVLRLAGKAPEARALLETLPAEDVTFEKLAIDAMATGDLEPFFAAQRRGAWTATADEAALLHLWAFAVPRKTWVGVVARPATLRRLGAHDALAESAELLKKIHTKAFPLASRLESCGALLDLAERLPNATAEVLATGAAARWLLRSRQPGLAALAARRYQALSATLSEGRSIDLFALALEDAARRADAGDEAAFSSGALPDPVARPVALLRLGLALLESAATSAGDARAVEYAQILTEHLRLLKGPVMKIGQMLGFYGLPLPEPASEALRTLQSEARAVRFADVRRRFEVEQSTSPEERFAHFDEEPFAVGSVGQVHLARTHRGETVAVKVLFPAIEACVRRDFRSARLLLPLLRLWMPHWDWPALLAELERQMIAECDLEREAEAQRTFRTRFAGDAAIVIPKPFPELSSRGILVSEYFEGERLDGFRRSASRPSRERAAETITRYVMKTVFSGEFNTDMHPGNLLFDGARVCFLDFGNVRRWRANEQQGWRWILESMVHEDPARLMLGLQATGHCAADLSPSVIDQTYRALHKNIGRVLASDTPTTLDKQTLLGDISEFGPAGGFGSAQMRIPPPYVYAFRAYWGCLAILSDLDVALAPRPLALRILSEIDAGR